MVDHHVLQDDPHRRVVRIGDTVCHGDFGPWNPAWRGSRPVGTVGWDYAWPAPAVHDVNDLMPAPRVIN
jgi:Ser/Thr protein kinase RdoA (MazF antagonist)